MSQGVKQAHQERSRITRDKLLVSLEKLLNEKDFADISVAEIAAEAGVSAASIYRRFDKKQGFIAVLFDLYLKRLDEWTQSPEARVDLEGCSLREALARLALVGWRQVTSQAPIMRAIHLHGRNATGTLKEQMSAYQATTLTGIQTLLGVYAAEIKRKDTDHAARMLAYYFNSIFIEKGLYPEQSAEWGLDVPDTNFTQDIADFAYGYLTTE